MSNIKQSIRDFYDEHSNAIKTGSLIALGTVTGILCNKMMTTVTPSSGKLIGTHKETGLMFLEGDDGVWLGANRTIADLGAVGEDILTVMTAADEPVTKDTLVTLVISRYCVSK